jgi:FkbM family methyltransferase
VKLASTYGMMRSLAVYYGQVWRRGRLEAFYRQFLAPGSLAFDIGSHVGNRTRAWRHLDARVVAVEPQPDFFRLLQRLFGRDPQVTLENCGIAAQAGEGTLWISSATPTVSSCTQDWVDDARRAERFSAVQWDQNLPITMRTLQELIDQYGVPDFCKIDIEGGEEDALRGLHTPIPALSFECVSAMSQRAQRCIDLLGDLGSYEFRYSKLETMRWSSDRWLDASEMKAFLAALPADAPAGDVYARRVYARRV